MNFIPEEIENYALCFTEEEPRLLAELSRETQAHVLQPRMLSGHLQGRLLSFISKLKKPVSILEIGTYTGYSALCLAEGLAPGGLLHTIDINEELESMVRRYIRKAGMEDRIMFYVGNALRIIPAIKGNFDLVFIDADKESYPAYFNLVAGRLSPGGMIIADNVLWSGKVLLPEAEQDEETKGLAEYVKAVKNDPRFSTLLLPVRDGLLISVKK